MSASCGRQGTPKGGLLHGGGRLQEGGPLGGVCYRSRGRGGQTLASGAGVGAPAAGRPWIPPASSARSAQRASSAAPSCQPDRTGCPWEQGTVRGARQRGQPACQEACNPASTLQVAIGPPNAHRMPTKSSQLTASVGRRKGLLRLPAAARLADEAQGPPWSGAPQACRRLPGRRDPAEHLTWSPGDTGRETRSPGQWFYSELTVT